MKKLKRPSIFVVVLILALSFVSFLPRNVIAQDGIGDQMRGLWVTSAFNLDWPSSQGLTNAEIMAQTEAILSRSESQNINAVFVQVRPAADALYNSGIFPWSHTISGTQGEVPPDGFDPLEHWIQSASARNIEVHAWLNPFRVTLRNPRISDRNALIATLSPNHPARLNPDLVIAYNNMLFFDPGNPDARALIINGIEELLLNYELHGIHLDDYFYPSRNFPDAHTFAVFGDGMDLHDWRRENINILIRDIQAAVRRVNPDARFGVSPFAIWQNDTSDPRGSATNGRESFHADYADTRLWVLEGWIDYIVPQIYWQEGHPAACFEAVLYWWEDLVRGTEVNLYIGHAVYRELDMANRPGWSHGEIVRQLERVQRSDVAAGSLFFRAQHMNSGVGAQIAAFYSSLLDGMQTPEIPARPPGTPAVLMDRLMVVQPSGNRTVQNASGFYFFGSGVAGLPLYVNGQLVTNRTSEGFFSVFMPLQGGVNNFTFSQEGQASITRVITNGGCPPAPPPDVPTMPVPVLSNPQPEIDEWARYGRSVSLSVIAPAGAIVWASVGETVINLVQANQSLVSTEGNIVEALFTGSLTLIGDTAEGEIIELGRPVYGFIWGEASGSVQASGMIRQIGVGTPLFAEISDEFVWVFGAPNTSGGSNQMLFRGQIDKVAGISGNFTRLGSGGWVNSASIRTWTDGQKANTLLGIGFFSEGRYVVGEFYDKIFWDVPFFPAVYTAFDGRTLTVSLGLQNTAPPIFTGSNKTLFDSITIGTINGAPAYVMTLAPDARLEGFYTRYEDGRLTLVLRRRRSLVPGNSPLAGFTFVIDPGHGGSDVGAIGPMGGYMAESHIVLGQSLLLAERLRRLGAYVVLTRDSNVPVSLQRRVDISRQHKPDMFISLHTNATAETTDATNIHGFTVWYRNPASRPAAEHFMQSLQNVNPRTNRNPRPMNANFFVCRPLWTPSVLFEASFTNNIHDFSWLICEERQSDYVWQIVNAILRYFNAD